LETYPGRQDLPTFAFSSKDSLSNRFLYPGVTKKLTISQEETGHLRRVSRQRINLALPSYGT